MSNRDDCLDIKTNRIVDSSASRQSDDREPRQCHQKEFNPSNSSMPMHVRTNPCTTNWPSTLPSCSGKGSSKAGTIARFYQAWSGNPKSRSNSPLPASLCCLSVPTFSSLTTAIASRWNVLYNDISLARPGFSLSFFVQWTGKKHHLHTFSVYLAMHDQ